MKKMKRMYKVKMRKKQKIVVVWLMVLLYILFPTIGQATLDKSLYQNETSRDNRKSSSTTFKQNKATSNKQKKGTVNKQNKATSNKQKKGTVNKQNKVTSNKQKKGTVNKQNKATSNKHEKATINKQKKGTSNEHKKATINKQKKGTSNKHEKVKGNEPEKTMDNNRVRIKRQVTDEASQLSNNIEPSNPNANRNDRSTSGAATVLLSSNGNDTSSRYSDGSSVNLNSTDAVLSDFSFTDNQLHLTMSRNVTPIITTLDNPNRVVIDLPNLVFSGTFYEKYNFNREGQGVSEVSNHPNVQRIRFANFKDKDNIIPNTVRFVIDANDALKGQLISNEQGLTTIAVTQDGSSNNGEGDTSRLPVNLEKRYTVVIDPGHGGPKGSGTNHNGASIIWDALPDNEAPSASISSNENRPKYEKEVTLALSWQLADELRQKENIDVVLTREGDSYEELSKRVSIAKEKEAIAFVSIHGNSFSNPNTTGTETYFDNRNEEVSERSKKLAEKVQKAAVRALGLFDRGVKKANDFVVVKGSGAVGVVAVLHEVGFLTNEKDRDIVLDKSYQKRWAQGLANAIVEWLREDSLHSPSESQVETLTTVPTIDKQP